MNNAFRNTDLHVLQIAKAKLLKAIELNERCFEAYRSLCMCNWMEHVRQLTDDPAGTLAQLDKTARTFVMLAPNSHAAHYCQGISNLQAARFEAAARNLRHSIEINSNDAFVLATLALVEVGLDNVEEAKVVAAKAIRLNPKDTGTGNAYLAMAIAAFLEKDPDFRDWCEQAIIAQPRAPMRRTLMIAHAAAIGDQTLLQEHLRSANEFSPRYIPNLLGGGPVLQGMPRIRDELIMALRAAGFGQA